MTVKTEREREREREITTAEKEAASLPCSWVLRRHCLMCVTQCTLSLSACWQVSMPCVYVRPQLHDVWTGVESFDQARDTGGHSVHQRTRVRAARRRRVRLSTRLRRRAAGDSRHGLLRAERCAAPLCRCLSPVNGLDCTRRLVASRRRL